MKNTLSEREKIKAFESMLSGMDSLTSIGFELKKSKHIPNNGPAGESQEFLLSGDNALSVEFTFYPAIGDKDDYVVVYVIDQRTGKDFSLDAWVQGRSSTSPKSPFKLSHYKGCFDQQLKEFKSFVNALFHEPDLAAVLEDRSWIDVKFNWGESK